MSAGAHLGNVAGWPDRVGAHVGGLVAHVHDALHHQIMGCLLAAGNLGGDVAGGNPGHLFGHVAGLGKVHRHRRLLYRWQGNGNTGRIDFGKLRVSIVGVHRDEALGVGEASGIGHGADPGEWRDDQRVA